MDCVLLWNNTDLKSKNDSNKIRILSKEILLAETTTDQGVTELYLLLAISKPPTEKQVVTLAGIGIDKKPYIKTLVEKFNEQSDKYVLQIRDYLSDGEMNPDANVFVDLNTFINADPSFSKDDYYWNIVDTCKTNEKLYKMCTYYLLDFIRYRKVSLETGLHGRWMILTPSKRHCPMGIHFFVKEPLSQNCWRV